MWRPLVLLFVVITPQSGSSADLVPCSKTDKDCLIKLGNLLLKEAVAGAPALNTESLDPLFYEEIDANIGTLKYKLTNSTVEGFKNCKVIDNNLSFENNTMHMVFNCPHFDMYGTYEMDGTILSLPIQGKGDFDMDCDDYHLELDASLKISENNGKKYFSIKSYNYSGQLHGGKIDMKNLFNGQKELADAVLKVMNENWTTVANELQGPVFKANFKKVVKNFNKYLKTKPIDGLIAE